MVVEIYKLQNDGSQKTVATCRLVEGQVVCEGNESIVVGLKNGIVNYEGEGRLLPSDGLVFLQQLKNNFRSGYLNASDVKES